jgi:hypothetical protein
MAQEVTDDMVIEATTKPGTPEGLKPGSPKFVKTKQEMILKHLDARPKKVAVAPEPTPPPPPMSGFARGSGRRAQG